MSRADSPVTLNLDFLLLTILTALNGFFGIVKFANALTIRYYFFYEPKVVNIAIFSESADSWIWAVTAVIVILAVLWMKKRTPMSLPGWTVWACLGALVSFSLFLIDGRAASLVAVPLCFVVLGMAVFHGFDHASRRPMAILCTLLCFVGILMLLEAASLSTWLWNAFDYTVPLASVARWRFAIAELGFFNLLYPWTTTLMTALLFSWIWIPLASRGVSKVKSLRTVAQGIHRFTVFRETPRLSRRVLVAALLLLWAAAAFLMYYPYTHLGTSTIVGADSIAYYNWQRDMDQNGSLTALQTDRPLALLIMHTAKYVTGLPVEEVLRILPIICAICLSLAVFWFVKAGTDNERLSLTAAVFSVFSFQTSVGMFAYSYANWLAMAELFALFALLLMSLQRCSWRYGLTASFMGVLLFLTHVYTWGVIMVILAALLGWTMLKSVWKKTEEKFDIRLLLVILALNLIFYAAYVLSPFGRGLSSASSESFSFLVPSLNLSTLLNLLKGLEMAIQMWVGGLFANPLLLVLSIAGMLTVIGARKRFNRIMLLWVAIPSALLFFLSPDGPLFYRILYVLPVPVLAAAGLTQILDMTEEALHFKDNRFSKLSKTAVMILVILVLANYSLRALDGAPLHIIT
ncbi:MAG: hypothetical protein ACE14S_04175 [Candidatus Bathyarchaeia archaeon]